MGNRLFKWAAYGLVAFLLLTGGWRIVWRYAFGDRRDPAAALGVGPSLPGAAGAELSAILGRHGVSSLGISNSGQGKIIRLSWKGAGRNAGAEALAEAQRRQVIAGSREVKPPDLRGSSAGQRVIADYAIW